MEALNHADQMRLANLINDNSDDAEIQKKLDQVVELTRSTREQAAFVLHDCNYDVEKAVDMILEGDHATVENQWKSAGKKRNKNNASSQGAKSGSGGGPQSSSGNATATNSSNTTTSHAASTTGGTHKNANLNNKQQNQSSNVSTNAGSAHMTSGGSHHTQHIQHTNKSSSQANSSSISNASNQYNNNNSNSSSNTKHEATDNFKSLGIASSNLISSSDPTTTATAPSKPTSLHQQQQQQHQQQQHQLQRNAMHVSGPRQHQKSTRIPDSAVEMPNNELQASSLNIQFGELDLRDGSAGTSDVKGSFQDVVEPNRMGRQPGPPNSHSNIPPQDSRSNRQTSQQNLGRGAARRPYNNNNTNDDRRFYSNSRGGGRQMPGNQRPYGQRPGLMSNNNNNNNNNSSNNARGVRTILNRGLQQNPPLTNNNSNQPTSGFPNSIDTWTNSTAEAATKPTSTDQQGIGAGSTLRVGQWSDVAGNEDWSEEDWDAKVMETKVFTPSSKVVDGPAASQKNQPLITNTSVPSQINLASKLSESVRDDVSSQQSQTQQSSQKPISNMNEIFDASVAKAMLEQQNLAAIKPKTSIGINQYSKDASDARTVLDQQSLSSIKPKTTMSMNQYNKDASESLKSLVGISSTKGGVPSVPPGALPLMSQPQYIMGNAYQPAIFPYAYQTPDVHYQVAAQTAGREQNFQSVYSPSDANKFNRGTDGDAPSITTTQAAPVASQTHNQAFVANALPGYQLTYAMPGAFNMMPQNLYSAAPIFPHIPQPTNTGSANTVYQKNTPASYQHHAGYSTYDQLNLIQDYVKQQQNYSGSNIQQQQHQPTSKASGVASDLDVASGGNSYNVYGSMNKNQQQASKQTNYNDNKGFQQQMSGTQQQFGFSHNAPPTSIAGYPLLQTHGVDGSNLNSQSSAQQLPQHSVAPRSGGQVNQNKYYPSWN